MVKIIDFIEDPESIWRFNRHTPSHSTRGCQKALLFDGLHIGTAGSSAFTEDHDLKPLWKDIAEI